MDVVHPQYFAGLLTSWRRSRVRPDTKHPADPLATELEKCRRVELAFEWSNRDGFHPEFLSWTVELFGKSMLAVS